MIGPLSFIIPVDDDSLLIRPLGRWVSSQACRPGVDLSAAQSDGAPLLRRREPLGPGSAPDTHLISHIEGLAAPMGLSPPPSGSSSPDNACSMNEL